MAVFQPALPMRGVTVRTAFHRMNFQFQPALPMRGVTVSPCRLPISLTNFNPHSPCGE